MSDCHIECLGDAALLLRFGERLDDALNERVQACAAALRQDPPPWLTDLTPAFASVALHVDVLRNGGSSDPLGEAARWLEGWLSRTSFGNAGPRARIVEVPVLYGGAAGPDLDEVARHAGISAGTVVARHLAGDYRVAMLGFAPGFAYLLGLDPSLAAPRLATPRTRVAAGSVGIGGMQTGIYPAAGPGGWRLIGRTPLQLFDAGRALPSLLAPGDRVRFVAIDGDAFERMGGRGA